MGIDLYECSSCDFVGVLSAFDDIEYDGDVVGICPNCKKNRVLCEVQDEENIDKDEEWY